MSFYVGSCRYLKGPDWTQSFPARLHTTKEMIYFFENINNIKTLIKQYPVEIINRIFGDITHDSVKLSTNKFLKTRIDKSITKVFLEVCSRKICYYNDLSTSLTIPIKWSNNPKKKYNSTFKEFVKKYNITYHELSCSEIENDLLYLSRLVKKIFNEQTEIHIIPNIDLKLQKTKFYIPKRHALVIELTQLCDKHGFYIHNIGAHLEREQQDVFLEDVMPDGGSHYAKKSKNKIIKYLNQIINNE